jgi:hypothetical protein
MDSTIRTALVAALAARGVDASVAKQIRIVEDDSNSVRDLTPTKAEKLMAMFGGMVRKYATQSLDVFRSAPRIVTAQRPFYERYRYTQHNGTQEMARRVRQMNRNHGSVRVHPGLLFAVNGTRYTTDSHGQLCPFYS